MPDKIVEVLRNVSMSIPEGKFTAIVGVSGSGKSTIIQLLERFYDPVEGDIFLDGHNIKVLNVKFLRSCMGLVSQEPVLFGTTVFENVVHAAQRPQNLNRTGRKSRRIADLAVAPPAAIEPRRWAAQNDLSAPLGGLSDFPHSRRRFLDFADCVF